MPLASKDLSTHQEGRRKASGIRTGSRTAADFSIDLGFKPIVVKVCNLTDRIEGCMIFDDALDGGSNAKGLLTVAAGTVTYADVGITLDAGERSFSVVVATVGLETDNDDVYWEAWT